MTSSRPIHPSPLISSRRALCFLSCSVLLLAIFPSSVSATCCTNGETTDFCLVYNLLAQAEQNEVEQLLGPNCDQVKLLADKRKPNFLRFGRSAANEKRELEPSFKVAKSSDPNFLRFGRSSSSAAFPIHARASKGGDPNFLRFGRSAEMEVRRFGKSSADPNFLRFGRAASPRSADPNFLRFGKRTVEDLDGLTGDQFEREYRKPNFLRFG